MLLVPDVQREQQQPQEAEAGPGIRADGADSIGCEFVCLSLPCLMLAVLHCFGCPQHDGQSKSLSWQASEMAIVPVADGDAVSSKKKGKKVLVCIVCAKTSQDSGELGFVCLLLQQWWAV